MLPNAAGVQISTSHIKKGFLEQHQVKHDGGRSNQSNNQISKEALQTIFYTIGNNSPIIIFTDVVSIYSQYNFMSFQLLTWNVVNFITTSRHNLYSFTMYKNPVTILWAVAAGNKGSGQLGWEKCLRMFSVSKKQNWQCSTMSLVFSWRFSGCEIVTSVQC